MEKKTGQLIPMQVFPAVVKEVDKERRTCTVRVNDNVDFYDVRLYAVTDKELKGFCLLPAVDSQVLVARIANGNELYVCSFSVVEKVLGTIGDKVEIAVDKESLSYKCDKTEATIKSNDIQVKTEKVIFGVSDSQVTVKADQVVFNDGENKGFVKVEAVQANLEAIKEYLTVMDAAIAKGLIGIGVGPTAQGCTGATEYKKAMPKQGINFQNMENEKIKH